MSRRSAVQAATAKWLRENPWFVSGDDYTADNAVLFIDMATPVGDDGFVEFVDTLVGDIATKDFDLSLWEEEEEEEEETFEDDAEDDGWDFI
jgi:hypothetical protein